MELVSSGSPQSLIVAPSGRPALSSGERSETSLLASVSIMRSLTEVSGVRSLTRLFVRLSSVNLVAELSGEMSVTSF